DHYHAPRLPALPPTQIRLHIRHLLCPPHRLLFSHTPPPPKISPLSLHDALPIFTTRCPTRFRWAQDWSRLTRRGWKICRQPPGPDRKSTRLNSSHRTISYAVFCLKKKNRRRIAY